MRLIERLPRIAITALITLAIVNLLLGVVLRYVVAAITNYMDWDPVPFTWVEEVGEMALAWLTLLGAAIGVRSRAHFTLHLLTPLLPRALRRAIDIVNHLLIAGIGAIAAWYAWSLCKLNWMLTTPGLEISLAVLYASAVVGGVLIVVYALSMIVAPPPLSYDPTAGD
jgi:TRAP-type C4-dicarboxylate transport system permease small subunit